MYPAPWNVTHGHLPLKEAKIVGFTLLETNIAPENRLGPKRKLVFQASISRGSVSFREGIYICCLVAPFVAKDHVHLRGQTRTSSNLTNYTSQGFLVDTAGSSNSFGETKMCFHT